MVDLSFGTVIDIDDPLKAQRVKVRVMGYYDNIPEDDLPWCQVLRDGCNALTFNEGTSTHNLVQGSQVLCAFLDHYHQQPIVLGNVPRASDCNDLTDLDTERQMTKQGHVITMSPDGIKVVDNSGNTIETSSSGIDITIPIGTGNAGNATVSIDNELNLSVTNCNINATNCKINATAETTIDAASCKITASGETTIDASKLSMKNITGPNQFCCLPTCMFTGAKHISPSTD